MGTQLETRPPIAAPGPCGQATLQIHPSLKCNLSCAHCYSSSGPTAAMTLDADAVSAIVADAAAMGYGVVSVSGGEPLMYRGLEAVLQHAKSLGLRTTVTTNGFFTDRARFARLSGLIDVLAISLDGPPEVHNRVRCHPKAFERLRLGLDSVRAAGIGFGFIHTLTRSHWRELPWVAEFAAEQGASLLQIHPLEQVGRARTQLADEISEEDILARVYVMSAAIASKYAGRFQVQLDLIYRDHLRTHPALFYADEDAGGTVMPAQQLGLLVLEPDGSVVPLCYGFSRRYRICDTRRQSLREGWQSFRTSGLKALRHLCRDTWSELTRDEAPLLSNWHEAVSARSHCGPGPASAAGSRPIPIVAVA